MVSLRPRARPQRACNIQKPTNSQKPTELPPTSSRKPRAPNVQKPTEQESKKDAQKPTELPPKSSRKPRTPNVQKPTDQESKKDAQKPTEIPPKQPRKVRKPDKENSTPSSATENETKTTPIQSKKSKRSRVDFKSPRKKVKEIILDTNAIIKVGINPTTNANASINPNTNDPGYVIKLKNSKIRKKKSEPLAPPKSPMRLSMKKEVQAKNEVFSVPKMSCRRKQKVSVEVAESVYSEELSHSFCSALINKRGKRGRVEDDSTKTESPATEVSPTLPTKQQEKLMSLEQSMNIFNCEMSPIASADKSSNRALKADIKQLPKRVRTRQKKTEPSLLKTPLRSVFKKSTSAADTSLFEENSEEDGEKEDDVGKEDDEEIEDGYSMFPLSSDITEPKPKKRVSKLKQEKAKSKMDYDGWLEDHKSDYDQFKDLELCVE